MGTILNRYEESGQPGFIPDFSGIALSFSLREILTLSLLYIVFIMLGLFLISLFSSEPLSRRGVGFCQSFSVSNEMIMWAFYFSLFIWWITLTDFPMLNHPYISGLKST